MNYPLTTLRKTICHEIGHSVGLTHYKNDAYPSAPEGQPDCMIVGPLESSSDAWRVYSAHHKSHINGHY
jgi:hypothetical protein